MTSVKIDELDGAALDQLALEHGWVYQSHAFGEVLREGLGQQVVRFTAHRDGALVGALSLAVLRSPMFGRFAESLPVCDHSGIIADSAETTQALLDAVLGFLSEHGLSHAELRQLNVSEGTAELPASNAKLTMRLALPSEAEVLWDGLKPKVRNLCRKGEKAGLVYRSGGAELLDLFFPVYARNLRDLGTPCYPRSLFESWLTRFPAATHIHLAEHPDGRVSAVGMTFRHADCQQIPFAASRREDRAISPNMFLYWKMLESSIAGGCTSFDFGRSTRDSGTWRFKKQWGAQEQDLVWSYVVAPGAQVPVLKKEDDRFALAARVWQKLPVWLATSISSRLAKVLP